MILSVPTVIQSPLGWSKSIHVTAEFSSRKAARGVRLGGERRRKKEGEGREEKGGRGERGERGKGRERGERKKKEEEGEREKGGRGVRWSNIYKI